MALPEDHQLCQVPAVMDEVSEKFKELCRVHAAFKRRVQQAEFPTRTVVLFVLDQQQRLIQMWLAQLEEAVAPHGAVWQQTWGHQKREWLDRLDADLALFERDLAVLWRERGERSE